MGVRSYIWGRFSGQAVLAALIACGLDQAHKYWMIHVFDMPHRGLVRLTPFFDLIMVWNRGISYGLFQQHSAFGQTVLIVISVVTVLALLADSYTHLTLPTLLRVCAPRRRLPFTIQL